MIKNKNGIPLLPSSIYNHIYRYMKGCGDKKDYQTFEKADFVVRRIQATTFERDHSTLESYRCEICGCIHIGHSSKRRSNCVTDSNTLAMKTQTL